MRSGLLPREKLPDLIGKLKREYRVFGPVRKGSEFAFEEIEQGEELCLEYGTTILPPKKLFTPMRETIYKFEGESFSTIEDLIPADKKIAFGIHPCDVASFRFLDRVFLGFRSDPRYLRRRDSFLIFALTCTSVSEECFCLSMGTGPDCNSGYDVLMTALDWKFLLEAGTPEGERILDSLDLEPATEDDFTAKRVLIERLKGQFKRSVETDGLPELCMSSQDHPLWERYGEICLACGQCAMSCPTCFCFDVRDEVDLSLKKGERYRVWDVCLLKEFSQVALGGNFRPERSARLRQFICHNLSYGYYQYSMMKCVGCGRCIRICPVHIDITRIARELREEAIVEKEE